MATHSKDKLTVFVLALLVFALFFGELATMHAIASHECQGASCIQSVHSK